MNAISSCHGRNLSRTVIQLLAQWVRSLLGRHELAETIRALFRRHLVAIIGGRAIIFPTTARSGGLAAPHDGTSTGGDNYSINRRAGLSSL